MYIIAVFKLDYNVGICMHIIIGQLKYYLKSLQSPLLAMPLILVLVLVGFDLK